jgi:hypothetical protein
VSLEPELAPLQEVFLEPELAPLEEVFQELELAPLPESLNPALELEPELALNLPLNPTPELDPRPPHPTAVTESKIQTNNAKEDRAVTDNATSLTEELNADSDPLVPPKFASPNQDVTLLEFAELPESDKTPRRDAEDPMEPEENAISPLEPAFKLNYIYHQKIIIEVALQHSLKIL